MMASRGHPRPRLTTDSDDSLFPLLPFGVSETWSSFEGHRRVWVYPRVDELPDRPPTRISRRSDLVNHIHVYIGPPDFSSISTPTTHAMAIWVVASSIPRTGASLGYTAPGPYLRISYPVCIITHIHTLTGYPRWCVDTRFQGALIPADLLERIRGLQQPVISDITTIRQV